MIKDAKKESFPYNHKDCKESFYYEVMSIKRLSQAPCNGIEIMIRVPPVYSLSSYKLPSSFRAMVWQSDNLRPGP